MNKQILAGLGLVVALVALVAGFLYFKSATGPAPVDIDLAKRQAAVEHSQFQGKLGGPPDAGAAEMAARQKAGP
jgi:hypothetical protein